MNKMKKQNKFNLDMIYDQTQICEKLVQEGVQAAIEQFNDRIHILDNIEGEEIYEYRCLFLNSLNRCLYYYILINWKISLSECCFNGKLTAHMYSDEQAFYSAGIEIIKSYNRLLTLRKSNHEYIDKAIDYIDEHINEELTLTTVAEQLYISPSYLCKIFKTCTGQSFSAYVNNRRITYSKKLLLSTKLELNLIAEKCGFKTASYFSTIFRNEMGMVPSKYRSISSMTDTSAPVNSKVADNLHRY